MDRDVKKAKMGHVYFLLKSFKAVNDKILSDLVFKLYRFDVTSAEMTRGVCLSWDHGRTTDCNWT